MLVRLIQFNSRTLFKGGDPICDEYASSPNLLHVLLVYVSGLTTLPLRLLQTQLSSQRLTMFPCS